MLRLCGGAFKLVDFDEADWVTVATEVLRGLEFAPRGASVVRDKSTTYKTRDPIASMVNALWTQRIPTGRLLIIERVAWGEDDLIRGRIKELREWLAE